MKYVAYAQYCDLLKDTLIEMQYYARKDNPIAKRILNELMRQAELFRRLRDKSKERAGVLLQ